MIAEPQSKSKNKGSAQTSLLLQRKCDCGSGSSGSACKACSKTDESELRRSPSRSTNLVAAPEIVNEVLDSPGRPLDMPTRSFMEPRFGRDFSDVRVHTGALASESAQAVGALAYTVGRDMVFGDGHYSPATQEGKGLLAHELTHVAQNTTTSAARSTPISIGPAGDRFEAEADRHASAVARGEVSAAASGGVSPAGEPGRLSRATFKVGNAQVEINYGGLGQIAVAKYESEIESRFESYSGAKATTIHTELTKLSAAEKEWVLYGLDLLTDNPATGLDKPKAVSNLIAHAPSARTRPTGVVNFDFENEALSVSGWFEKALTSGLTPLTSVRKTFVQGLLNPNTSSSGSSSCPSPRQTSDQLNTTKLQTDMPTQLKTYLQSVSVPTKVTTQSMTSLQTVADLVQGRARNFFAPYADKSSGSGNTVVQQWQYSSHLASAQGPSGTPSTDKRLAYLDSRARIVGGNGLFGQVHFDFRCPADEGVMDGIIKQMEPKADIRALVDPILRQKSYTDQNTTPKGVVLNTALDATKYDECLARWSSIKTMCHELMHVMVHPDFRRAEKGRPLLVEGFPEVLGHQLYSHIANDAGSDPKLEAQVEAGLSKTPCASIPSSTLGVDLLGKATSYKQAADDADRIRVVVTNDRFRAAFFLGQLSLAGIQPKRIDGAGSHEPQEREADDAAEAVIHSRPPQTSISRAPSALQARDLIAGSGSRLQPGVRRDMESSLGHDFSEVRLHTDAEAAQSAGSMNARAYTVGRDIVFGAGQYAPHNRDGRSLLAHELTHVVQQSGASRGTGPLGVADHTSAQEQQARAIEQTPGPVSLNTPASTNTLQVHRAPAPTGSGSKPSAHITQIVVNQNINQTVTATFSDGSKETGTCSTGKGHCCFDEAAGAAEGGACSAAHSTDIDNNCTPVGDFTVTTKVPKTASDINFWTQFHDAKQVALHEYWPVDGTPLSHGCVRLETAMAKIIFDGARTGITKVKVEGLAKPQCANSTLQSEWAGDFKDAGKKPPDGTMINPQTKKKFTTSEIARETRHIKETRKEMRSALGVGDTGLDAEVAAVAGGASVLSKIPRCLPALTVEEKSIPSAQASGFLGADASKTSSAFAKALSATKDEKAAEALVKKSGEDLWNAATAAAKTGGAGTDDRQLFWTRLMMTTELRKWSPSWVKDADSLRRLQTRLLQLFEQTSRGMTSATFPTDPDKKRILASGFDPFGFPNPGGDIRQSNLSGAIALALDGETLTEGTVSARVEAAVFPVRYADFNEGVVENYLRPHLTGSNLPHLVMSISQGSSKFELEESAGRRRSTDKFADNLGQMGGGGSPTKPIAPPGVGSGAEFIPHTVPAPMLGAMRGAAGRKGAITEETGVKDLPPGAIQPRDLPQGPGSTPESKKDPGIAVEGSGGGFLSNEIFYRNSLLQASTGTKVPMIHLHTPMLEPGAADAKRNTLIDTAKKILRAALAHL